MWQVLAPHCPRLTWVVVLEEVLVLSSSPRPSCPLTTPGPTFTLSLAEAGPHGPQEEWGWGYLLLAAVGHNCASQEWWDPTILNFMSLGLWDP